MSEQVSDDLVDSDFAGIREVVRIAMRIGGLAPPCLPVLGALVGFLNPFGGGDHWNP